MLTKYQGTEYNGSPIEILKKLRNDSFDKRSVVSYSRGVAKRVRQMYSVRLDWWNPVKFLRGLEGVGEIEILKDK